MVNGGGMGEKAWKSCKYSNGVYLRVYIYIYIIFAVMGIIMGDMYVSPH